jgi:hypothetical protein
VGDGGKFSGGMAADSRVAMQVLLKEHGGVFKEVKSSLVDVGGSHGATATAVAKAFPHLKCTVLDLADVVALAPANDRVTFLAGDMFKYVPPADAVLLKVKIIYCTSIPSIGSAMHGSSITSTPSFFCFY